MGLLKHIFTTKEQRYKAWLDEQHPYAPPGITRRDIRNIEDIGIETYRQMCENASKGIPQRIEFINRDGEYQSISMIPREKISKNQ